MMRVGTVLTLSLAVAAGIGLFYAKHRVQALEAELAVLQQQILSDRESIHVLKAEWSFLNDPARLSDLARRHLEMAPVSGSQLASIDDIPEKLPLPPEQTPEQAPDGDEAPAIAAPQPESEAQIAAAPAAPAPSAPAAPAPAPTPAKPAAAAPAESAPSPFAELPADVQAVLASMRTPE